MLFTESLEKIRDILSQRGVEVAGIGRDGKLCDLDSDWPTNNDEPDELDEPSPTTTLHPVRL